MFTSRYKDCPHWTATALHLLNWKHSRWTELIGVPRANLQWKSSKHDTFRSRSLNGFYASLVHHPPATLSARSATGCVVNGSVFLPTTTPTGDETCCIDGSVHDTTCFGSQPSSVCETCPNQRNSSFLDNNIQILPCCLLPNFLESENLICATLCGHLSNNWALFQLSQSFSYQIGFGSVLVSVTKMSLIHTNTILRVFGIHWKYAPFS